MITKPLDLASRLRLPPASLNPLFVVNVGLLVLFFQILGSRFVLAPGLAADFSMPRVAGASLSAATPTCAIRVMNSGQIFTDDGIRTVSELAVWLHTQFRSARERGIPAPNLLLIASGNVPTSLTAKLSSLAAEAGFAVTVAAEDSGHLVPDRERR